VNAHEGRRILSLTDFYNHFEEVLQLFRQHNFIAEYEVLHTGTAGWGPYHVPTDEAVIRLTSLHTAIHKKTVQWVANFILEFIHAHDPPGVEDTDYVEETVDDEILTLLRDYRPFTPFDNISDYFNTPWFYSPHARGDEQLDSVMDKENIDPSACALHLSALLAQLKTLTA
jgi:hypothetical protein